MRRARPHLFLAFDFGCESFCREGAFFLNAGLYSRMANLALVRADIPRASKLFSEARELPPPHRIKIHRNERGIMGEVLKQSAVLRQELPHHRLAVILIAGPEDVMMRPRDIANGIELNKAKRFNYL